MESIINIIGINLFEYNGQLYSLGQVFLFPLIIFVVYYFFKKSNQYLSAKLRKTKIEPDLVLLIQRIYVVVALVIVAMTILELLNVPLTAFAFISGAVAIGVGFGAQNIINNFISGWILMWERPIRIGDFFEIGDVKGTVETINTRSTRIRRTDGVHLLIPNSHLLENMVVNWTLIDKLARGLIRVGVAYGSPVKKVAELIEKAANLHPNIHHQPEPLVIFEDFGDSALIFDLYFWIDTFGETDLRIVRSDIRFKIDELFAEEGIVIAFPQQDVHLDGELKLIQE